MIDAAADAKERMREHIVQLESFQGPLDLLLFLIRRDELDLHDIPIARITEQYLEFLEEMRDVDMDSAGEFLVMAATLMEIKSRMLEREAARASGEEPDESRSHASHHEDPRASLVEQLLAYKTYRDASDELEDRFDEWSAREGAARAGVDAKLVREAIPEEDELDLDDLALIDIVRAFENVLESVNFDRLGEHEVFDDDTPIELHAADVVDLLAREGRPRSPGEGHAMRLAKIFGGRSRASMIGVFLALLELVRQQRVKVSRDEDAEVGDPSGLVVTLESDGGAPISPIDPHEYEG